MGMNGRRVSNGCASSSRIVKKTNNKRLSLQPSRLREKIIFGIQHRKRWLGMTRSRFRVCSFDGYLEQTPCGLDKAGFIEDLSSYLATQPSAPVLDKGQADTLFEITSFYLRTTAAIDAMREDRFTLELTQQIRLLKSKKALLAKWNGSVHGKLRFSRLLQRKLHASLRQEIEGLGFEIRVLEAERDRFVRYSSAPAQRHGLFWELDEYVRLVCLLRPKARDIVIAGVYGAAGLVQTLEEPVSVMPKRRSKAKRELSRVEMCYDWARQIPRRSQPSIPKGPPVESTSVVTMAT